MKYLYLMGASGCGKTTLAKKLDEADPSLYHRILEITTRPPREREIQGYDYDFKTDEEYLEDRITYFERVEHQFYPYKYAAAIKELQEGPWNIVVASIEGFLTSVVNAGWDTSDSHVVINIINDVGRDVERWDRLPEVEEAFNIGVLSSFKCNIPCNAPNAAWLDINDHLVKYISIRLSTLKEIRDNKEKLLEYFYNILR